VLIVKGVLSWESFKKVKDQKFQQLRCKFSNVSGLHEEVSLSKGKVAPMHATKVYGEVVV